MKKFSLLLVLAILLVCCVIAQKNQTGIVGSNLNGKSTERNYANKFVSHNTSAALLKQNSDQKSGYLFESFEGTFPPTGWAKQNPDGGTGWGQCAKGTTPLSGWNGGTQSVQGGGGNFVAYCTYNTGGMTSNDQWLISPQISVHSGDSLKFFIWRFGVFQDTIDVLLSTTTDSIQAFTTSLLQLDTNDLMPMSKWKKYAINLTPYAGQNIYIAFREHVVDNYYDGAYIAIDIVSVPYMKDVSVFSIDEPATIGPATISPKATVFNYGSTTQTFDVTMKITGGYSSTKTVTNLTSMSIQQVTFDQWNASLGNDTITVYTQLIGDTIITNDTISQLITVKNLTKAYCYVAYSSSSASLPQGPAYTYLETPWNITSIANQSSSKYITSGTWGKENKWYGVAYDSMFVAIDTTTGARTNISNLYKVISGISYDYRTSKFYAVAWDGQNSSLYYLNLLNNQLVKIGVSCADNLINLACDTSGNLYSVGITSDNFYSINKYTGVATAIGSIGFNAQYAQDMEFDRNTNTCYMSAYGSGGELRSVDIATGSTTLIGAFPFGAEITGLAIPYFTQKPALDGGVIAVTSPSNDTSCTLSDNEIVKITIMNLGTDTFSNFSVLYQINNGSAVSETITDTILPDSSYIYSFTQTANLSTVGTYNIKVYTNINGDNNIFNDTCSVSVVNTDAVITIKIKTDKYPKETSWQLVNKNTNIILASIPPKTMVDSFQVYTFTICAFTSECYKFIIFDTYGDGILSPGGYEVYLNGDTIVSNYAFYNDSAGADFIGNCAPYLDAEIAAVYTLGKLPVPAGIPHNVSAILKNNGTAVTNFKVILDITGANTFADTLTIANFKANYNDTVFFNGFSPNNMGVNDVKVWLNPDTNITNNSAQYYQLVNNNTFAYADTSKTDRNLSLGGPDCFMLTKYHMNGSKIITQVNAYITGKKTIGNKIYGVVLDSAGNIIGTSPVLTISASDTSKLDSFNILSTPLITDADFYVGFAQIKGAASYYPLGVQPENPKRAGAYYAVVGLTGGVLPTEINSYGRFVIEGVADVQKPYDAFLSKIISPLTGCILTDSEDVKIEIINVGINPFSNFNVSYSINGNVVNETITNTVNSGDTLIYTFNTHAQLSTASTYNFKSWLSITNDNNHINDTIMSKVITGVATAPYTMGFEPAQSFTGWNIEDVNNDGKTWSIVSIGGHSGPYCMMYAYTVQNAADDWFISKCVELDSSKTYKLTYWYKAKSPNFPEKLKVCIGNAPVSASLTTILDNLPNITNTSYIKKSINFTVPSNDYYYIGWKCYSNADMFYLYVDDINISDATGIEEITDNSNTGIYPNPAQDILNVFSTVKIIRINLYNLYGQLIASRNVNEYNYELNVENLANGIYYLKIETKDGVTTKDLIISK